MNQSKKYKPLCNDSCFKVIDSANNMAIHIECGRPSLNMQQKMCNTPRFETN